MGFPLLTYDRVSISYRGVVAVHDVSFSLAPGRTLGIVGESGSGKSTLVKAAMGLLGPAGAVTQGDIYLNLGEVSAAGRNLARTPKGIGLLDLSPCELRSLCGPCMGMVFQDSLASLTPIRRIGDQIFESLRAHSDIKRRESDERAIDLLARLNIKDPEGVLASYPFELSGGMGQRVGIALALLPRPSLLFADEPTSALDTVTQKQVVELFCSLRERAEQGMVIVTHNIGVVRALADDVLVLKDGAVQDYGPAEGVLNNPSSDYTRHLIAAVPRLKREVA